LTPSHSIQLLLLSYSLSIFFSFLSLPCSFSLSSFLCFKASNEWTWSGANTQIGEIEKIRSRMSRPRASSLYRASFQTKLRYDSDVVDDFPREFPHTANGTATNKSMLRKLNPFKRKIPEMMMKRHSLAPGQELGISQRYLDRRESMGSVSKNYLNHARASIFSMPCYEEEQSLLETTSVADLIRAIEMLHIDSVVPEEEDAESHISSESLGTKQRKMEAPHLSHKPSLLTLLNKNHHSSHTTIHGPTADISPIITRQRERLYSCANLHHRGEILGDANPFARKQSISAHPPPPPSYSSVRRASQNDSLKPTIKRRFSVRPANLDRAPGQFHKVQNLPVIPGTSPTQHQQQQQQQQQNQTSNSSPASFTRKLSFRTVPSSLSKSDEH
jgi:hypothetical protein